MPLVTCICAMPCGNDMTRGGQGRHTDEILVGACFNALRVAQ